jgi:hypothetical protein
LGDGFGLRVPERAGQTQVILPIDLLYHPHRNGWA